MPRIKIKFYITGKEMKFDIISREIGIKTINTRKKNEFPIQSIEAGLASDLWELIIDYEESKAVSKQLDKLQKILMSKIEIIKELCDKYKLETSVTVVVEMEIGDGPEMVLTKENIQFLAAIGAEIGFDMYID